MSARSQGDNRFGLLLGALVSAYVISAFLSGYLVRALQITLFLAVVLIAVRTSRISRRVARLANAVVLGGSVVAIVVTRVTGSDPVAGTAFLWMALMLLFSVLLIVGRVLARSVVTLQSIFGAISAYLIIGLMFAACYSAMSKFSGDRFFAGGQDGSVAIYQYFSFTTLTTVGYGDYTAATSGGRAVAVMEALLGQVFLVTLVASLVSAYQGQRSASKKPRCHRRPARPRRPTADSGAGGGKPGHREPGHREPGHR